MYTPLLYMVGYCLCCLLRVRLSGGKRTKQTERGPWTKEKKMRLRKQQWQPVLTMKKGLRISYVLRQMVPSLTPREKGDKRSGLKEREQMGIIFS